MRYVGYRTYRCLRVNRFVTEVSFTNVANPEPQFFRLRSFSFPSNPEFQSLFLKHLKLNFLRNEEMTNFFRTNRCSFDNDVITPSECFGKLAQIVPEYLCLLQRCGSAWIRIISLFRKAGSASESNFRSHKGSPWTLEPWMLTMQLWRVFRPEVADSHHLDEEPDLDPNPSEEVGSSSTSK